MLPRGLLRSLACISWTQSQLWSSLKLSERCRLRIRLTKPPKSTFFFTQIGHQDGQRDFNFKGYSGIHRKQTAYALHQLSYLCPARRNRNQRGYRQDDETGNKRPNGSPHSCWLYWSRYLSFHHASTASRFGRLQVQTLPVAGQLRQRRLPGRQIWKRILRVQAKEMIQSHYSKILSSKSTERDFITL